MQKIESILWRGMLTVITAAAMFVLTYRYAFAEETAGGEVYFTHSHTAVCKTVESVRCSRNHSFWLHRSEKGAYHCSGCDAQTAHKVETDVHRCADTGDTWQENGYTQCSICGTIHSRWGGPPGDTHFYNRETLQCGLSQGERTAGVRITADGAWTNQGVTLTAKQTIFKNDGMGSIAYSWDGGSFTAEENGVYTVSATNGAGVSLTASIEISCIDKTVPVILSGDTQGMTAAGISVSVSASDEESGLPDAPYSYDGGVTWTAGASCRVEEGREIFLCVRDRAGNISRKTIKRSDFPYPPTLPAPQPAPQPSQTGPDGEKKPADSPSSEGQREKEDKDFSLEGSVPGGLEEAGAEKEKPDAEKTGSGTAERKPDGGKNGSGRTKDGKASAGADGRKGAAHRKKQPFLLRPQPALLKEPSSVKAGSDSGGFRVMRMDKSHAGMAGAPDAPDAETIAAYMQAAAAGSRGGGNGAKDGLQSRPDDAQEGCPAQGSGQSSMQNGKDGGARYALTDGLSTRKKRGAAGIMQEILRWVKDYAALLAVAPAGLVLCMLGRMLWLSSAELYCYEGGSEYRRLGVLCIRKRKKGLELYLPEYILTKTGAQRYRLVVKEGLVKRFGRKELLVHSGGHHMCRPLEECVDFVL